MPRFVYLYICMCVFQNVWWVYCYLTWIYILMEMWIPCVWSAWHNGLLYRVYLPGQRNEEKSRRWWRWQPKTLRDWGELWRWLMSACRRCFIFLRKSQLIYESPAMEFEFLFWCLALEFLVEATFSSNITSHFLLGGHFCNSICLVTACVTCPTGLYLCF